MNVGKYLRGEDRHVGTARVVKPRLASGMPPQFAAGIARQLRAAFDVGATVFQDEITFADQAQKDAFDKRVAELERASSTAQPADGAAVER